MLNEQDLEDLCIDWFQQTGWQFAHGPDIAPEGERPERTDFRQVVLRERLLAALARINPQIPPAALEQAVHALQTVSEPQLVVRNRAVHRLLLGGVNVSFSTAEGEGKVSDLLSLIDFANPSNNEFLVVNQFTVAGGPSAATP
jgi:type I restriction enzyme, R subunit